MKRTALLAALALAACQQEAPSQPAANEAETISPPATGLPGANEVTALNDPAGTTTTPPEEQASDDWRKYAKSGDADRLQRLDAAWSEALATVSKGGTEELEKLGPAVDPKTPALANPHPAPGVYRCRTIKMGDLGLIAYDWFRCRIELTPGGDLTFEKLTGSQRGVGKFYPSGENERRLIYLGGQAWGLDQKTATRYGEDRQRDQIGVLERIGDQHWRLVLPWPMVESELDIVELKK
ncbi:MAG TPA: DUF4893 domain-containing protein [Caulobacteraceae bacterium]